MLSLFLVLIINSLSFAGKKSKVIGVCILAILVSSIAFYVLLTMTTTTTSISTAKSATTSMTTTSTATATTTSTTTNSCKKSTCKE